MGEPAMHQHENVTISPDGNLAPRTSSSATFTYGTGAPNDVLLHGASIVFHEKADDMVADPTGNAGNRIACGVIPSSAGVPRYSRNVAGPLCRNTPSLQRELPAGKSSFAV